MRSMIGTTAGLAKSFSDYSAINDLTMISECVLQIQPDWLKHNDSQQQEDATKQRLPGRMEGDDG